MRGFFYGFMIALYALAGLFIGTVAYGLSGLDNGSPSLPFAIACGVFWPLAILAAFAMIIYANLP